MKTWKKNGRTGAAFALCAGVAVFSGCSTGSLRVQSVPEGAEVFLIRAGAPPNRVGKTPMTLEREAAPDLFGDNVELRIERDGFQSTQVVVPRAGSLATARLNVLLKETKLPESCSRSDQAVNEVAKGVAELQSLIQKKKYEDAERRGRELAGKYGTVSVFHMLLGNALYLKKDLANALLAYKKAKDLEPSNLETGRMIQKITAIVGNGVSSAERAISSDGGGN